MTNVTIKEQTIKIDGKGLLVKIIKLGKDQEGWTVPLAAEYLGCTRQNVDKIIRRHNIHKATLGCSTISKLKEFGVIVHPQVNRANFLSQDSIKALVKIVGTPQAWAVYNQLWEIAENPEKAAEVHVELYGFERAKEMYEGKINELLQDLKNKANEIAEVKTENNKLTVETQVYQKVLREIVDTKSTPKKRMLCSKQALAQYVAMKDFIIDHKRQNNLEGTLQRVLTNYLLSHNFENEKRQSASGQYEIYYFYKEDLDAFESSLRY